MVFGREIIEVATFRANSDDGSGDRELDNGRLVRDNVYGTIEEDAIRRDFTCNALYYAIEDFSVRDYCGGFEDVQARLMKLIGDPELRYQEDPVRMLRAVRLASKLNFEIEAGTAEPIPRLAGLLSEAAPARLFEEILKLFLSGHGVASFEGLERYGLFGALFPESAAALKSNRSGALRAMVLEGLRNTDARVANDEPVSPAFLFALLLWPAFCRTLMGLQAQGVQPEDAQRRAADRVTLHQLERVALPRRFSLPMQEIWLMQTRSRRVSASGCCAPCRIRASARRSISWCCASALRPITPAMWSSGVRRRSRPARSWWRRSNRRRQTRKARRAHRASVAAAGAAPARPQATRACRPPLSAWVPTWARPRPACARPSPRWALCRRPR